MSRFTYIAFLPTLVFISGCYFGSTLPDHRKPNEAEQKYLDIATQRVPEASSSIGRVRVVASASVVEDYCPSGAAACSEVTIGVIFYDGKDMWAFVHELVHVIQWSQDYNPDYRHEIPFYWAESGGNDSLQIAIWGEEK